MAAAVCFSEFCDTSYVFTAKVIIKLTLMNVRKPSVKRKNELAGFIPLEVGRGN